MGRPDPILDVPYAEGRIFLEKSDVVVWEYAPWDEWRIYAHWEIKVEVLHEWW